MNSDYFIANDVRPVTSLNISAIGEPEESRGDANDDNDHKVAKCSVPICPPPGSDECQEQVEDMDQESLVPRQVPDVSQPTQQEVE